MKKLIFLIPVFVLASCDNVDITKYPESVQSCYNGIINADNTCTKRKKTIVKYCQCNDSLEPEIQAKGQEIARKLYLKYQASNVAAAVSGLGILGGMWAEREKSADLEEAKKEYAEFKDKLYDKCAKKTGYIRAKNCKVMEKAEN